FWAGGDLKRLFDNLAFHRLLAEQALRLSFFRLVDFAAMFKRVQLRSGNIPPASYQTAWLSLDNQAHILFKGARWCVSRIQRRISKRR
ncbi:hypothetical protein ACCS93_39090, partial [Rhizobium ruizarguesonis]